MSGDVLGRAFEHAPAAMAIVRRSSGRHHLIGVNAAFRNLAGDGATQLGAAIIEAYDACCDARQTMSNNEITKTIGGRRFVLFCGMMYAAEAVIEVRAAADGRGHEADLRSYAHQLRDLVDNSTALMWIKDGSGRFLFVNDYFARWFGKGIDEIIGRTHHDLFSPAVAAVYEVNDEIVLDTGDAIEVEEPQGDLFSSVNPTDPTRMLLSLKFPLYDDDGTAYAVGGICTDITDRKRAELAAAEARAEAERANQSKSEFLSRMSHELRTPLNAILGFTQLLRSQTSTPDAAHQLDLIHRSGQHLLTLVDEVLDLSWIESGSPGMRVEPVSATDALRSALEIIRPLATERDIEIASDLHVALHRFVVADPHRLLQVFLNLLGNAVKFNRPGGLVRISCRIHGTTLRYRVTDTGPGLSDSDRARLFVPFSRLPGAESVEGSGLGLSLSRVLVERMGGEVGLERSAPGEGSTFYLDLCLFGDDRSELAVPQIDSPTTQLPTVAGGVIVQIEDTYANRTLIEAVVTAMGNLELHSAETGSEGLDLVRDTQPDLVLLDLNLPDMSGFDVLAAMSSARRRGTRVIVLSADASPTRARELDALGVDRYITKPVDVAHLATAIAQVVGES